MQSLKKDIHFEISERKILLRLMDIAFVIAALYTLEVLLNYDYLVVNKENSIPLIILIAYISIFGTIFEIYDLQKASKVDVTFKNIVLTASTTVLFYMLTPFFSPLLPDNRVEIVYFYFTIIAVIFIWRLAYVSFITSPRFYKKVLLVGEVSNLESIVKPLNQADPNYKIIGFVNCEESTEDPIKFNGLKEYAPQDLIATIVTENISEVVVASYNSETITHEVYHDLITLLESGFTIREYTQVFEEITYRVPVQFVGKDFYKYFPFSRSNQNKLYLFFRRAFDIVFSILGIIVGVLLIPFVFLANAMANRGPLFYWHERVGQNNELFKIIKFRTMIVNAEKNGAEWAKKNDVRVTRFGKFMRRSRLDEFPQFVNVLKGEMSIIGPRPERPFFVNELSNSIPFYETRHIIKPGLTGWAQVKTRYGTSVDDSLEKLQYDLYYIKHRSFFLDINILVKTLSTMLYYRGQ